MTIDLKRLPTAISSAAAQPRTVIGQTIDQAKQTAEAVKDAAVSTGQSAFDAGKTAGRAAVREQLAPFNIHDQLQALQPGDTYKLGASGEASVEGVAGQGSRGTTVTRTATGFVVAAPGELGAGLTTGKLGSGDLKGETSVFLGAGGRAEFSFSSAADAERAAKVLQSSRTTPPSADDLQFLQAHLSAVEVKGAAAADLSGKLGGESLPGVSTGGGAGARGDTTVRLEFTNGQPSALAIQHTLTATLSLKTAPLPFVSAGGSTDVSATVEQRMTLPSGLSLAKVLSDPGGAIKATGHSVIDSGKVTVTLSTSSSARQDRITPGVVSQGVQAQVRFEAGARDVGAAVGRFMTTGDHRTSLASVGNATNVSASLATTRTVGISARASGGVGFDSGVELELKGGLDATRTHSDTVWRYPPPGAAPATLNETIDKLASLPAARPSPFIRP